MSIFIIAEAGVNHNGRLDLAKQMVDCAVAAGADCVKFQTFCAENIVQRHAKKAEYQIQNTQNNDTQLQMLKDLELPFDDFICLQQYCIQKGILFLSTPFDLESIRFLESIHIPFWKIPSGEITNYPYLVRIAKTGKDIVLSTGMSNLDEIGAAVNVLRKNNCGKITLLQCNTQYPTPFEDVNLNAMKTLRETFHVAVGYSDHTPGIEVPIAAAALGAVVIEKHFTLDKNLPGPDHKASLEPAELAAMVQSIRHVELAMGNGEKRPSASESGNITVVRKSIVAKCNIKAGELLSEENLIIKRPGSGLNPMLWENLLGKTAIRDFEEDEQIQL